MLLVVDFFCLDERTAAKMHAPQQQSRMRMARVVDKEDQKTHGAGRNSISHRKK